jgi:hypothetical protein
MNEVDQARVRKAVAAFIDRRRPPIHIRDKVDLSFRFDGRYVEIFEIRPNWQNPSETHEEAVARARYLKSRDEWLVYWQRADMKWHKYAPAPEVTTIHDFLELVDEDAFGCFFG